MTMHICIGYGHDLLGYKFYDPIEKKVKKGKEKEEML